MRRRLFHPLLAITLLACARNDGVAARPNDAAALRPAAVTSAVTAAAGDSTAAILAKADAGRILGNPSASVWLIVISDFQCPFCKTWHDDSWAAIKKDYVDTGKIRVAYMNLPLPMHKNAWPAAHAAMCASVQGKFWEMQDALFREQQSWEKAADPGTAFETLGRGVGVDPVALRACITAGTMQSLIAADADRATRAGAQSTPTFFVGNKAVVGAQPFATFRDAIEAALAAKPAGK